MINSIRSSFRCFVLFVVRSETEITSEKDESSNEMETVS